ncbi:ATP-dependent DNA helicase PIF1 [Mytilus galloprovincialis]|uniref:ATP-dependent DNA helicase n=1 Tax=Mytilus galloprovincialis TaxID=29158 RepID=A0A8B6FQC4_MYTGA|nr:ATP-dependent DNA helicase PIF1 [Mytilus galloprovincialis]
MLDEDQKITFELANGHNLIISGQAGTGKSFLIKYIVKDQREKQKNVAIVCSTGIASTLYEELGAKTLHKWAGIEDRRHLNEEIIHLVQSDERFMSVKHNIQTTDLLIIDEVSMVSAKTFNKVEVLCRKVRDNNKYFGGIQVILSGDFYQLPPVPNKIIGDSGSHCFKLPWFDDCFPHKVQLNIIHRQSETALIQCINALEKGEVSNENVAFLNSLDRPLPNEDTAVHLYARNYDVDIFNYNKLQQLQGDLKTYKSTDVGSDFYLRKFLAPKNLGLKEPESIKNIPTSDELSSPARGKIRYISGYVLAKLKHNLSIKIRNSLFAVGSESKIAKLQDQMNILSSLCSSYDVLLNSSIDPESLEETKRKQNERESLTNITDVTFDFFSKLETLCRQKLSHINLVEHGKKIYSAMSQMKF